MTPERVFVMPDLQFPFHDVKSLRSVLRYISENRYDRFIQLGDFMDWNEISRWTADNARLMEGWRFQEEYDRANKFLDAITYAVRLKNPECKMVILQGNHDYRVEVVMDKEPKFAGMLGMEKNLRFDERNIEYWKYWEHKKPYKLGKAYFIHGQYTNDAHAKKHALNYNRNLFYGHTHDHQLYSKTIMGKTIQAESLGTMCRYDMPYMGNSPSNWSQCFAEFYFRENGEFNHFVTNITNHTFTAINGKFYQP